MKLRTLFLFVLSLLILLFLVYSFTNSAIGFAGQVFWTAIRIKLWFYLVVGLLIGLFIGFSTGFIYARRQSRRR